MGNSAASIIAQLGVDAGTMRPGLTEAKQLVALSQKELTKIVEKEERARNALQVNLSKEAAAAIAKIHARQAAEEAKAEQYRVALSKEAAAKIVQIKTDEANRTKAAYAAADKSAAVRQAGTAASIRTVGGAGSSGGRGAGRHGGGLISQGTATVVGEGLDAVTGTQGWVMKAQLLARFGAIGTAITAVAITAKNTIESLQETKKANVGLQAALSLGSYDPHAKREALNESIAESEKSLGGFSRRTAVGRLTANVVSTFTGKDVEADALALQTRGREELLQLDTKIAERVHAEGVAREMAAHGSARAGELEMARLKTEEKIEALHGDKSLGLQEHHERVSQARAEAALEEEAINKKHDATARDLALEKNLAQIKRDGQRVEVYSADAQLSAATFDQNAATTDEEKAAAAVKVQAAKDALEIARKNEALKKSELALEAQIANTANPEARERLALEGKRKLLLEQMAKAKPDEKAGLEVSLAQNSDQLRTLDATEAARRHQEKLTAIDADTGVGAGEQLQAREKKLVAEQARLAELRNDPTATKGQIGQQRATVNGLAREIAETKEQRAQTLHAAQTETAAVALELQHQDSIAEALRTKLEFEEKITAAKKAGNKELAGELQKQQSLAQKSQAKKIADSRNEANKGSLGALAANARNRDGRLARQAQRLDRRADRERDRGHVDRSNALRGRANEIKKGIGSLRDSEKDLKGEFSGALDACEVLKSIEKNTKAAGANR